MIELSVYSKCNINAQLHVVNVLSTLQCIAGCVGSRRVKTP